VEKSVPEELSLTHHIPVLRVTQQLPQIPCSSMIPNYGQYTEKGALGKAQHFTGKGKDINLMAIYLVLKIETILTKHHLCTRCKVHATLT
jgi:hypothetical protein